MNESKASLAPIIEQLAITFVHTYIPMYVHIMPSNAKVALARTDDRNSPLP